MHMEQIKIHSKKEMKCNNVLKQYGKLLTMMILQKQTSANII